MNRTYTHKVSYFVSTKNQKFWQRDQSCPHSSLITFAIPPKGQSLAACATCPLAQR